MQFIYIFPFFFFFLFLICFFFLAWSVKFACLFAHLSSFPSSISLSHFLLSFSILQFNSSLSMFVVIKEVLHFYFLYDLFFLVNYSIFIPIGSFLSNDHSLDLLVSYIFLIHAIQLMKLEILNHLTIKFLLEYILTFVYQNLLSFLYIVCQLRVAQRNTKKWLNNFTYKCIY